MDADLTTGTVRDGPVSTLILRGELDLFEAGGFLEQAVLAVDSRTERLVLDLAGVTFLDCTGARALAMAASFAPAGCPVIIRSVSPAARRILTLLGLDLENPSEPGHADSSSPKSSATPAPSRPPSTRSWPSPPLDSRQPGTSRRGDVPD